MQHITDQIIAYPIAFVKNNRTQKTDDHWNQVVSEIKLIDDLPESSFDGIEAFSHLEIIFHFNQAQNTVKGSEHPRGNLNWPKVGIFAQRKKDRPNHLGLTIVQLLKKEGRTLTVSGLDAMDGTPVLDIKPVFKEFLPKEPIEQAEWSKELMKQYW